MGILTWIMVGVKVIMFTHYAYPQSRYRRKVAGANFFSTSPLSLTRFREPGNP